MKLTRLLSALLGWLVLSTSVQAGDLQVPSRMAAPMVLYDEGGNVLPDGDYGVGISLKLEDGTLLYAEEQRANVRSGVAPLTIGDGFVPGSNLSVSTGGISVQPFLTQGEIAVEILVEGQVTPQEIAVLGSQPYAFVAQEALSLSDDAVTTASILDGTITWEDLSGSLQERIANAEASGLNLPTSGSETATAATAQNVSVDAAIGLNNASGNNVQDILQGLDGSLDTLREGRIVPLEQSVSELQTDLSDLDQNLVMTQTELDALEVFQGATQADVNATQANVTALQTQMTGAQSDITTLDANLVTTQTAVTSVQADVSATQANVTALQTQMTGAQSDITTLDANLVTTQNAVTSVQADVSATQANVTTLQSQMTEAQSDITTLDTNLVTTQSAVNSVQADVSATQANVTALQTQMTGAQTDIATLDANLASTQGALSSVQSGLATTNSTVAGLSTGLGTVQSGLSSVQSGLAAAQTSVNGVANSVTSLDAALTATQSDVSSNYLRRDSAAAMVSQLDMGGNGISNVGDVDGVDVSVLDNRVTTLEQEWPPQNLLDLGYTQVASGTFNACSVQTVVLEQVGSFSPGQGQLNGQIPSDYVATFRMRDNFASMINGNHTFNFTHSMGQRFVYTYGNPAPIQSTLIFTPLQYSSSGNCSGMLVDYVVYKIPTPAI